MHHKPYRNWFRGIFYSFTHTHTPTTTQVRNLISRDKEPKPEKKNEKYTSHDIEWKTGWVCNGVHKHRLHCDDVKLKCVMCTVHLILLFSMLVACSVSLNEWHDVRSFVCSGFFFFIFLLERPLLLSLRFVRSTFSYYYYFWVTLSLIMYF